MAQNLLTNLYLQLVGLAEAKARASNIYLQVLTDTPSAKARATNVFLQVLTDTPAAQGRLSNMYLQALVPARLNGRPPFPQVIG